VRGRFPFRTRLSLPATLHAVEDAVRQVRRAARRAGLSDEAKTDLEIATREAMANAIRHGAELQREGRVFVRCYAGPQAGILIAVRDWGNGFDPAEIPDPRADDRRHLGHGRGILLMRSLTDWAEHRRGGREVLLYKARPSQD
jgi:serine/threonine-protein kinase RsbW